MPNSKESGIAQRSQEIMDEFYSREEEIDHLSATREIATALAQAEVERDALREALERIASNEAFGTPGILDHSLAARECRNRMRVAREALERTP